ncbi:MAG: DUF1343 domain-containing protein [Anaerolineae bacterium]|nr:DUF1343 domain-containing protein [Anaerolineae bacterium]
MRVQTGLASFLSDAPGAWKSQRVGLVTHAAAVAPDLGSNVDALIQAGVTVTALFSPEHGLHGATADGAVVHDSTDAQTGLPVYSLYGRTKAPSTGVLAQLDTLIFDMQDVGVRFYTYISTLYCVLKSAAQVGLQVTVLDRPNPINGMTLEGPRLEPGYESFVGIAPIPLRYGLTIGELARYMNAELRLGAELTVVPMENWRRDHWYGDTGLAWVPTSPAMPHLTTTVLYPGMCLLEGTNLSEGRGTALPFEICGAPWIDGAALASHLNALSLPGVRFRPVQFVPAPGSRFGGELCGGVQVHVLDHTRCRPLTVGLHLIACVKALYPADFAWQAPGREGDHPHFDLLVGTDEVRVVLDAGSAATLTADIQALIGSWAESHAAFAGVSQPYLLYPRQSDTERDRRHT